MTDKGWRVFETVIMVIAYAIIIACFGVVLSLAFRVPLRGTTRPPSEKFKRLQMAYCGCGGEEKLRQDKERDWRLRHVDRDDLCGRNDIVFRSHYQSTFEPTELEDLPIFQVICHTKDATGPQVVKSERPTRAYIEIGVLKCPLNWYYLSTLEGYLQEKTAAVGGHAILLMEIYEIGRAVATEAGEIAEEAVLMSVNAQVIYFAPDRRRWMDRWGTP